MTRQDHINSITQILVRVRWPGRDTSAAEMPFIDENWQRFYGPDGPGAGLGPYEP